MTVLQNLKFLIQDTNIINTRTNQQLKLIETSILTVAEACDQFRIGLCSYIIRCKASNKAKKLLSQHRLLVMQEKLRSEFPMNTIRVEGR